MTNKRFIVETVEITDCDTDESRIAKVITDTNELYSYDDLYELCEDLNKLAEENEQLKKEKENLIKIVTNGRRISYTGYIQLEKENEQLRQILNDIVLATDETYAKTKNSYKVTVAFDSEKYLKICECIK